MRSAAILSTLLVGLGCADAFVAPSPRSVSLIGNGKLVPAVPTSLSLSKFGVEMHVFRVLCVRLECLSMVG